jgi:lysozyme
MSWAELEPKVVAAGLDMKAHPFFVVGYRGYYAGTMGGAGNDSGIYDDAIFLVSPDHFSAYNANTDPSTRRAGIGTDKNTRGRARLQPGVWIVYRFDIHGSPTDPHFALCQRGGNVRVMRDGTPDYPHEGKFGINIHRGGHTKTSSLGCQTIFRPQWDGFINAAIDQGKRYHGKAWKDVNIPYVLLSS